MVAEGFTTEERDLALKYARSIRAQYGPGLGGETSEEHSDEFELNMTIRGPVCGVCFTLYRWHLQGIRS